MLTKDEIKARLGMTADVELARLFGITDAAVSQWRNRPIPAARWLQLKHELRPDVFGPASIASSPSCSTN
jgi:DNA-binding transcriptional regulator YdaS (Cro superfamily)